ncbi:hypothetical protein Syn7803US80_15 [Synechococcus phage ACG-2014d]|uniref:Uncharacterized protein n=1 Tax=Synechococcus phage ACG-2014d TaxID=1493509 RepID=A0A0E3HWM6_9CAUD|nr:hypothetical protein Syn7803US80_15 [Synechococcus phage ACG-2014d]
MVAAEILQMAAAVMFTAAPAVIEQAALAFKVTAPAPTLAAKAPAATVNSAPPAAQLTKNGPTVLIENLGIGSNETAGVRT